MKKYYVLTAILAFVGGFVAGSYAFAKDTSQDAEAPQSGNSIHATFKVKQPDFFLMRTVDSETLTPAAKRSVTTEVIINRATNKIIDKLTGDLVGYEVITDRGTTEVIPAKDLKNFKYVRTQNLAREIDNLPKEYLVEPSWGTFMQSLADCQFVKDLTSVRKIYESITKRSNFTETDFAQDLAGRSLEHLDKSNAASVELAKLVKESGPKAFDARANFEDIGRVRAREAIIAR